MNTRKIAFLLALILLPLVIAVAAASPQDTIIVNNAKQVKETSVSIDQGLVNSIASVSPRVVVQYSNAIRRNSLLAMPSALQTLLSQVSARVVVQYANTNRRNNLVVTPSALQTLLGQVADRVIVQYANTNRRQQLVYPTAIINDTTPPQISGITASATGVGTVTVTWTTDEFATSTVLYGTQSGSYSQTASDPLYVKQHQVILTGLTAGARYYYQVHSTDRSGNTATSSENTFVAQVPVYLPLILR
jgi:hypothetical protein